MKKLANVPLANFFSTSRAKSGSPERGLGSVRESERWTVQVSGGGQVGLVIPVAIPFIGFGGIDAPVGSHMAVLVFEFIAIGIGSVLQLAAFGAGGLEIF